MSVTRETNGTRSIGRSGFCGCGNEARPNQGYCYDCHAAANRMYRRQRAAQHAANERLAIAGISARIKEGPAHG